MTVCTPSQCPTVTREQIDELHAKYLRILTEYRLQAKAWERKLARLKKIKWEYYNGKMDQVTLNKHGWVPFPFVLKADIHTYMEADADIQAIRSQQDICEEMVEVATTILKALNNRTWEAKEFAAWQRFISGQ